MNDLKNLLSHISNEYSLDEITSSERVIGGYLTINYKIQTQNGISFFLKQHRHTNPESIDSIVLAEQIFSTPEIPIVSSLPNISKKYYTIFEEKFYSLYPFVTGLDINREELTTQHTASMGRLLALIHKIGTTANNSLFSKRSTNLKIDKFQTRYPEIIDALNKIENKSNFDKLAQETLKMKNNLHQTLPYYQEELQLENDCIVHGDFHNNNLFFDHKGQITVIFDLEKTEYAPRLFEIIRSIDYSCFYTGIDDFGYQLTASYIKSYNQIFPIDKQMFQIALKAYLVSKSNNLWIENEHYIKNNHRVDILLNQEYNVLKYLQTNHTKFISKLLSNLE